MEGGGNLGRGVANAGFLRALLREDPFSGYHFFLPEGFQANALRELAQQVNPALLQEPGRLRLASRPELPRALRSQRYHCFHLSDCINSPAHLARLRNLHAPEIFPITSLTHSLSYARYSKDFLAQLWPGCTPRDVIVATSETAREMLHNTWTALRSAYALDASFSPPDVQVIPLGIECESFVPVGGEDRQALRRAQGINEADCVLLVFARLSHTAKLDALPLFRALRRAARPPLSMESFTVIMAGGHDRREASDYLEQLRTLAGNMGLKLMVHENPDEQQKLELFSLSDVFVSPVDNYQETFGISLLEAGAMGLPVVASDFDGYRFLVRDGETGILVSTTGPSDSRYLDAAANLLMENQHQLLCSQQVALDVPVLARALRKLAMSPGLRASMGHAARRHVCQTYSWQSVIWRYVKLWDSLWHKHLPAQQMQELRELQHPLHVPLAEAFSGYPSMELADSLRLRWSRAGEATYRGREGLLLYGGMQSFIEPEWVQRLLFFARKGASVASLRDELATQAGIAPELAAWCVLWALKHDLLEREDENNGG